MNKELLVTKASGTKALFSEAKLYNSLHRAGATEEQIAGIIQEMSGKMYNEIPTKKIYKMAFSLLKNSSRHLAAKYHLKQALMELGPSGFPFEKYIGAIMSQQGYNTVVGEFVNGKCVQHEIDVIAVKDHLQLMIECKYHNHAGIFCDVKVPLYIQSRFKDVEYEWLKSSTNQNITYQGGVVTNTRFSSDAIKYGTCAGLRLISWDYPLKGSLKDQIDDLGLYPITCLTSLTKIEKQMLLDRKVVLCLELSQNTKLLIPLEIKASRMDGILQEIHQLSKITVKVNDK
ncbi:MAG: ATP-cone domain protein [Bacteroidota bacterium]|nr:ATP-cone domain protein [Bacteroidota bacterium]